MNLSNPIFVECRCCQVKHAPLKRTVQRLAGALLAPAGPTSGDLFLIRFLLAGRGAGPSTSGVLALVATFCTEALCPLKYKDIVSR